MDNWKELDEALKSNPISFDEWTHLLDTAICNFAKENTALQDYYQTQTPKALPQGINVMLDEDAPVLKHLPIVCVLLNNGPKDAHTYFIQYLNKHQIHQSNCFLFKELVSFAHNLQPTTKIIIQCVIDDD